MGASKKYCQRTPMFGNNCSKAHNITKRKWNLNMQQTTIKIGNNPPKKIMASVRTIRTLKKQGKII